MKSNFHNRQEVLKNIFIEAESNSGTWSYSLTSNLKSLIQNFKSEDTYFYLTEFLNKMNDKNTQDLTIFKLSQLCSIFKAEKAPNFEEFFLENQQIYDRITEKLKNKPLNEPISRLIKSFTSPTAQPMSFKRIAPYKSYTPSPEFKNPLLSFLDNDKLFINSPTPPPNNI